MKERQYHRIMLGAQSSEAANCFRDNEIAIGWFEDRDLEPLLSKGWTDFRETLFHVYLKENPEKHRVSAGLACGMVWTFAAGLQKDDLVLCPDGLGLYHVGEVQGPYFYRSGVDLPHRRKVRWLEHKIARADMSESLRNSTGSIGTVSNIGKHAEEINRLLGAISAGPTLISNDPNIEDPSSFALEKHLEDFLVINWDQTDLGRKYDIYAVDGAEVGQQFPSDTGPIDILAISKDRTELLVVELKRGRASDAVVGQIQRYMGFVKGELAEEGQSVRGCIIALDDDLRLKRALSVTQNIDFYRYQISFKLVQS